MTTSTSTTPSFVRFVNTSPRLYQNLDFHKDIMHDTTPRKLPAKHPEDEEMVREWRHKTMVEDQQKELDQWRDVKDMAARERWAKYWAAWAPQKSLDEEKEKGKKRKRYDTKEEAEAATRDDRGQRSRLCEIGRRQQYGSNLCTFQKGAQGKPTRKETNK